jgi:hypothetical protein
LGGILTSGPAATIRGSALYVFTRGSDNAIWHRRHDFNTSTWSNWESLGGVKTSAPAAATRNNAIISVYAKGTDNAIWLRRHDGTSWSNWESLGGVKTSAPAAGALAVHARGTANTMWSRRFVPSSNSWENNWYQIGSQTFTSGPADAGAFIAARGTDNAIWVSQPGAPWVSLGGSFTSGPAMTNIWTASDYSPGDNGGEVMIAARGVDKTLWAITRACTFDILQNASCRWSEWSRLGG